MDGKTVFVKTAKGVEEMEQRTYRLPLKTRQVLIMADGKRDLTTLSGMVAVPDVEFILEQLVEGGFLSSSATSIQTVVAIAATSNPPESEPSTDSDDKVQAARSFIINTTQSIVGVFGSGLIEQARKAKTLDELRRLERNWSEVILSEAGKKHGAELKAHLAKLLA